MERGQDRVSGIAESGGARQRDLCTILGEKVVKLGDEKTTQNSDPAQIDA